MAASSPHDAGTRVIAGDCTVCYDSDDRREYRGRVLVVVKADNTVLVHDADGYQPVAWLTRADTVAVSRAAEATVVARTDDETLRVVVHSEDGAANYPTTTAGVPVGDCPDCERPLVRTGGAVTCTGCGTRYGLPAGATVRAASCECGLPRVRAERGVAFDVCLDRRCESLDDAVAAEFDRRFDCPDCGGDLRVLRRGGLLLGCDAYPDCDVAFAFPTGTLAGTCECGLPRFETATGERCLDSTCE